MNINISSIHFNADEKLEKLIEDKIKKLTLFSDSIISADVFLRLESSQTLENKVTEIKLEMQGNALFAKKQSNSFEKSTDSTIEALRRQINKQRTKNDRKKNKNNAKNIL